MSTFLDHCITPPAGSQTLRVAWHPTLPLLAASFTDNSVGIFSVTGEKVEEDITRNNSQCDCSALAWHPKRRILIMGWADGEIVTLMEDGGLIADNEANINRRAPIHTTQVFAAEWNERTAVLVTGDGTGAIGVWKLGDKGFIENAHCYHVSGVNAPMKHIAFVNRSTAGTVAAPMTRFFIGGENGIGVLADDLGNNSAAFSTGVPISALLYDEDKAVLVCITASMVLTTFHVSISGVDDPPLSKVKMGAGGSLQQAMWAGKGILATVANEGMVRIWDMGVDEHYFIVPGTFSGQKLGCIAFDPKKKLLAAGATSGSVILWRHVGGATDEKAWELFDEISLDQQSIVTSIKFGSTVGTLVVSQPEHPTILQEVVLMRTMCGNRSAMQIGANKIALVSVKDEHYAMMSTNIRMIGGALCKNSMAVWNGDKAEVYGLGEDGIEVDLAGTFSTDSHAIAVHDNGSVLVGQGYRVDFCNAQGTVKQSIEFSELEGEVTHINVLGRYAVVATNKNFVKIFDLKRREARVHSAGAFFNGKNLDVVNVYVNSSGSAVALICQYAERNGESESEGEEKEAGNGNDSDSERKEGPDSRLHVYFGDKDSFLSYDFASRERYPVDCRWDQNDGRLLAIHTRGFKGGEDDDVTSLFVTQDGRIVPQEASPILFKHVEGEAVDESEEVETAKSLVGISVPNVFFSTHTGRLLTVPMSDFAGIGDADAETTGAMMDFSYYLTIGNMDEAFKTVRIIRSSAIWHSMAAVCVKTKRLDVAQICLGHMGHSRAVRGLREASEEEPIEARLAVVAIHLGLIDEAERLYRECERFDLLNKLYQATGKWEKALEIAKKEDRIHLKPTYIKYAQFLASNGDVTGAVRAFEEANVHKTFVPRLLQSLGRVSDLQKYIADAKEDDLVRWWGQFCESSGDYEKALEAYEDASDIVSQVRVRAFLGETEKAATIARDSGNPAASYHMARHFESQDDINHAVRYYEMAKRFNHAVRLAKELDDPDRVVSLALQSGDKKLEEEAATYFEESGIYDKAVTLYHRAGALGHAADLCFRAKLFDQLKEIGDDLDKATDPALLERCADFFLDNGQYERAVRMLVRAGSDKALEVALEHKVALSGELASAVIPGKTHPKYQEIVTRLAEALEEQGNHQDAAKRFTQAGDKVRAMKCMLRGGDTKKIIMVGKNSRHPEVFKMVANYLQGLDWRNDTQGIMTQIIFFYSKAKAFDQLADFYDACAQVEIDNYQNYEKGLEALNAANNSMKQALNIADGDKARMMRRKQADLSRKITLVNDFVVARGKFTSDGKEAADACERLLDEPDLEPAVRAGDVYAVLVEYHHLDGRSALSHRLLERMRAKNIPVSYYVEDSLIRDVHEAVGAPPPEDGGGDDESDVEEAVESEVEDVESDVEDEYVDSD